MLVANVPNGPTNSLPILLSLDFQMHQSDLQAENAFCEEKRVPLTVRPALRSLKPESGLEHSSRDPQTLPYYAEEILDFMLTTETVHAPGADYMTQQSDINYKMRAILVDWLVTVHLKFKLLPETLFQTVNLIDRYLSKRLVTRQQLQLVGVTGMLLACKYEEIYPPEVKDFVHITDRAYTREQVVQMECEILGALEFSLTSPSAWRFLERFLSIAQTDDTYQHFARYLLELSLVEYHMLKYRLSLIAASATYIAMRAHRRDWSWSPALAKASKYSESQLKLCVKDLLILFQSAPRHTLSGVRDKFARREYMEVAKIKLE